MDCVPKHTICDVDFWNVILENGSDGFSQRLQNLALVIQWSEYQQSQKHIAHWLNLGLYLDFGIYLNLVHDPKYYNLNILPNGIKEGVIDRLESIPKDAYCWQNYLPGVIQYIKNGTPNVGLWKQAMREIKWADSYRNQSFREVYPDYYKLIQDTTNE